jgi:bacterioferritin-associated ferredoxin
MYICVCNGVTESAIKGCMAEGHKTRREVVDCLYRKNGKCCKCIQALDEVMNRVKEEL